MASSCPRLLLCTFHFDELLTLDRLEGHLNVSHHAASDGTKNNPKLIKVLGNLVHVCRVTANAIQIFQQYDIKETLLSIQQHAEKALAADRRRAASRGVVVALSQNPALTFLVGVH